MSLPKPTRPGVIPKVIWSVDFQGNKKLSSSALQKAIETAPTPFFARTTRLRASGQYTVYNKAIVRADLQRLQNAYRYHGFYRAKVEESVKSPVILTQKSSYRPYQRVRVIFNIEEGPQAELLTDAEIIWQLGRLPNEYIEKKLKQLKLWDGKGKAPSLRTKVAWRRKIEESFKAEILQGLKLKKGESFSTPDYQNIKASIVQRLQDASFALAEFSGEVVVEKDVALAAKPDPKKTSTKTANAKPVPDAKAATASIRSGTAVKMRLIINSGPSCRFGAIALKPLPLMIDGRSYPPRVDYKALHNYIKFKKGEIYKIQTLIQTQRALSGLGLFSSVDFKPEIAGVRARQTQLRNQIRQAREIRLQKKDKQNQNKASLEKLAAEKQSWIERYYEQKARLETSYRAFQIARARRENQQPPALFVPRSGDIETQKQDVARVIASATQELRSFRQTYREKNKQRNAIMPLQDEMIDLYNEINSIQLTQKQLDPILLREQAIQKEIALLDKEFQATAVLEEQAFRTLNEQVSIPITLELREDRPGLGKFGGGLVIDGQRNQIEVSGGITLHNIGQLGRLEFQLRPGWSFLPDIFRRIDSGPDVTGSASFVQPFFANDRQGDFRLRLLGSYTQQIGDADFWRLVPSASVSYPLLVSPTFGTIQGTISLNGELANVQNVLLPRERETYAFAYLEQQLIWSWLNDPIRRTSGFEFKVTLQQALGSYAYIKAAPELSFYIPLATIGPDKLILAGRFQYGVLFSTRLIGESPPNFGTTDEDKRTANVVYRSPLTQRFYLGGANSVRGWTARYLGPLACQKSFQGSNPNYVETNTSSGENGITDFRIRTGDAVTFSGAGSATGGIRCREQTGRNALDRFRDMARYNDSLSQDGRRGEYGSVSDTIVQVIPMGGEQQIYGSLELRVPLSFLVSSLGLVLFADVGVVQLERRFWDDANNAPPSDLLPSWSLGFGIRYHTVIGAIRLDIAWRLFPDADRYPLQRDWQFHFSIGEAF